jgi:hypothetical protein
VTAQNGIQDRAAWRDRAACRGKDRSLWFDASAPARAIAERVCARCPVRRDCAEDALALLVDCAAGSGVWAGVLISRTDARRQLVDVIDGTGICR